MTFAVATAPRRQQVRARRRSLVMPARNRLLRSQVHSGRKLSLTLADMVAALRCARRGLLFVTVSACLVAATVATARFALTSPRFRVVELRVVGAGRVAPDELRRRVALPPDANIFRIRPSEIAARAQSNPWLVEARVRRELPGRVVLEVVEHRPRASVLLGHPYLVDEQGRVFKRATGGEGEAFPLITGVERRAFIEDRTRVEERLRGAVELIVGYESADHPPLGEVHLEPFGPPTLYTRRGATQIRLGEAPLGVQWARLGEVWAALGQEADRTRAIFLDHRARADRVTVRSIRAAVGAQRARE